jgi:thioredoxin-related protein
MELVWRYTVGGYPTVLILDAAATEILRLVGYRSSKEVIELLNRKRRSTPISQPGNDIAAG